MDLKTNGYALLNDSQKVALYNSKNLYILNLGDYSYSTCNVNKQIYSLAVSEDNQYIYFYSYSDTTINKYRICSGVLDKEEKDINNFVSLSPNPATDYIEISIPVGEGGVRIFDLLGMEITTPNLTPTLSEGEGVVRLDVSGLSPGVYFVRVGNSVRKFVKI
jgi:hypothetical protein